MQVITLDFETYWTSDFSLSKISFIEYIKSPLFEVISVAVKVGDQPTKCVFGHKEVGDFLRTFDWANSAAVAHNGNEFDHPLLVWTYDCHPKLFVDTLALSKAKFQSEVGGSLKALSTSFGLPEKDNTILTSTKGKRYVDMDLAEMRDMAAYNRTDTDNTYELFKKLRNADTDGMDDLRDLTKATTWHKKEMLLSDMTARMICYPQLHADTALLDSTLKTVTDSKEQTLHEVARATGMLDAEEVRSSMASAAKFRDLLKSLGVDAPMKTSKTTGKQIPALAKTDPEFTALLEHEDETVQLLASTRLGVKSTLLETRLHKMSLCAKLMGGTMPVPLAYHAATTGRWGGRVWNPQNLPRLNKKKAKLTDALRNSLIAPPGHKIVVSDLSGIELRVNHYLWNVASTQRLYDKDPKADLYVVFAAILFNKDEADVTNDERQLAKVAHLGLGFGAGWATFKKVAKLMGGLDISDEEAERVTNLWRLAHYDIVNGWRSCQALIRNMAQNADYSPDPRGLVRTTQGRVVLPSGRSLYYPGLRQVVDPDTGKTQFMYGAGRHNSKVYSGLMDENIVQAIARDVIAEQALNIYATTGFRPAHMVHDELVYVVPEGIADAHLRKVNAAMRTPPAWLPGIVLWSEGGISDSYGGAK